MDNGNESLVNPLSYCVSYTVFVLDEKTKLIFYKALLNGLIRNKAPYKATFIHQSFNLQLGLYLTKISVKLQIRLSFKYKNLLPNTYAKNISSNIP